MKTDYSFLPAVKQAEIRHIIKALVPRFSEIEMIILFGSYARNKWIEDVYVENTITYEYKSDYDLLIVTGNQFKGNVDTLTGSFSSVLQALNLQTPVSPIVHGIEFINTQLQQGNYFFEDIKKEGIVLFNTTRFELAEKKELSPLEVQTIARENFEHWFNSANEFFIDYTNAFKRDSYNNAAFLLHQATERYYGAIQLVFTGYKPKTHDIEALGQLAKSLNMEFGKVFPRSTELEQKRFQLLKRAYVDARYKKEFQISKTDLEYLSERVTYLRQITEQRCGEKIQQFTH